MPFSFQQMWLAAPFGGFAVAISFYAIGSFLMSVSRRRKHLFWGRYLVSHSFGIFIVSLIAFLLEKFVFHLW